MRRRADQINYPSGQTALIAVLKAPRDLCIAAQERWYRIPLSKAPKHDFTHIAFYQPACFAPEGKRIRYYAEVTGRALARRLEIFPEEPWHPAAEQLYFKYTLGPLLKLPSAVVNNSGSRVSFGYAPLKRLGQAGDILGIFNVFPVENTMCAALKAANIAFTRERVIMRKGKVKYRLDFALYCKKGKLDIECDSRCWHSPPCQHCKDCLRDKWLKRFGWTTLRFGEHEVLNNVKSCIREIRTAIKNLCGLRHNTTVRNTLTVQKTDV